MNDATDLPDEDFASSADEAPELTALAAENAALKEQVLRIAAEAENTRRRHEKEANDARAFAIQRFARDLLDAADNLGRAVAAAPREAEDPAVKNLVTGIEMTEKALLSAFERNGLKRVSPERGDRFDPHAHQAMMEQPADDVGPGAVTAVMAPGYELFGRMVRPAMVAVNPKAASPVFAAASAETTAAAAAATSHADIGYGRDAAEVAGASVDRRA